MWASTKSSTGSHGDQSANASRREGYRIAANSVFGDILEQLGVAFEAGQCLPPVLEMKSVATGSLQPQSQQAEHEEASYLLADCAGRSLHTWWQKHQAFAVEKVGWVMAAHVHAAAFSVASANVVSGALRSDAALSALESTACHVMALKYVATTDADAGSTLLLKQWASRVSISELVRAECRLMPAAKYTR